MMFRRGTDVGARIAQQDVVESRTSEIHLSVKQNNCIKADCCCSAVGCGNCDGVLERHDAAGCQPWCPRCTQSVEP